MDRVGGEQEGGLGEVRGVWKRGKVIQIDDVQSFKKEVQKEKNREEGQSTKKTLLFLLFQHFLLEITFSI